MFQKPIEKRFSGSQKSQIIDEVVHEFGLNDIVLVSSTNKLNIESDLDVLGGYLTYDMNELHCVAENMDFDIDDIDPIDDEDEDSDIQKPNVQTRSNRVTITGQSQITNLWTKSNCKNQESGSPLVQVFDDVLSESLQCSGYKFYYCSPDGNNDDEKQVINDEDDVQGQNSEEEDQNLFDSLGEDDNVENNNDPYRIMIRYPNQEYNVSVMCPQMSDYDIKKNQIALINSQLLTDHGQMDEFYYYLKQLGFQRELNILSLEDLINQDLLINITAIERQLENMRDFQQKWLEVSPTYTFSSQLQTFSLQLERFSEMVHYILEYNAGKASGRRFQHGRQQCYFMDLQRVPTKQNSFSERDASSTKRFQFPLSQAMQKELKNKIINCRSDDLSTESTQMCVALFKAKELYNQFLQFLNVRRRSQKYNDIIDAFRRIKSRFKMFKLLKNNQIVVKRESLTNSYLNSFQDSTPEHKTRKTISIQECFNLIFPHKRLKGLSHYFLNATIIILIDGQYRTDTLLYKAKLQSHRHRNSSHAYQQFTTMPDDD